MNDRDDYEVESGSFATAVALVSTQLKYVCGKCGYSTDKPFGIYDFERGAIVGHICDGCAP